ncbi:hypothetical protein K3495_g1690 [Podosphaera aphanis]|nr:hypothetical protein K3495_g1690 [Podosphaera aphanis]
MATGTLKTLYEAAEKLRADVDAARDGQRQQEAVQAAIARYEECLDVADRIALFSPNETLDDLTTGDLPYLLLHYWLAELLNRLVPADRPTLIARVRAALERFLHRLDQYELLAPAEERLYAAYLEAPTAFAMSPVAASAETQRSAKIARYKQEKTLERTIQSLAQRTVGAAPDDADMRELYLARIALCALKALQDLESLNRELQVLALAPASPSPIDARKRDSRERMGLRPKDDDPMAARLDQSSTLSAANPGPILSANGKPLRPFTLLDSRQTLQNGVFRSGHNLPTMTIDEYLAEERARGGIIEGGGPASGRSPEPDEDNYDLADQETMKARAWDDFTEENPKGSGNTLNKG